MSLEAIGWVLRDAPDVPAQCVSVLIGLAEHADKQGRCAYPSAATLAAYARKSERQVRYDLSVLAEAKLIRLGDQSEAARLPLNRRPMVYDLAMELSALRPGMQSTAPLETEPGVQSASGVQSTAPQQSTAPHQDADLRERVGVQSASPHPDDCQGCNAAQPGVQCTAYKPSMNLKSKPSSRRKPDLNAGRDDAMRLCLHLADRIERNDSLRPVIGKKWLDAARLMLDNDKRGEDHVHKVIDWCQDSEFWRSNILSMPKLRAQYDQMRLQTEAERKAKARGAATQNGTSTTTGRAQAAYAAGQELQALADQGRYLA